MSEPESKESVKPAITKQLGGAMKARDVVRTAVLRQIKTEVTNFESSGADKVCDEAELMRICKKLKKQREESIAQFEGAGRNESAAEERAQLVIVEEFLPAAMDDATLTKLVKAAINEVGAKSPKELGNVMKAVMPKVAGAADGKAVSAKVRELLSS